jgi:hypothetical protein
LCSLPSVSLLFGKADDGGGEVVEVAEATEVFDPHSIIFGSYFLRNLVLFCFIYLVDSQHFHFSWHLEALAQQMRVELRATSDNLATRDNHRQLGG